MSYNIVGVIVCVAMIVCGMGAYFIGRTHGIEYVLTRLDEIVVRIEEDDDEQTN